MIGTSDLFKDFCIENTIPYQVINMIENCSNIFNGNVPWKDEETKTLHVAKTICEKVAKAVTIEFKSKCEDEEINKVYQKFLKNIRIYTEYALGKGGVFFKPFFSNGKIKISTIHADKFIPTKFDTTGELLGAIFIDQIIRGKYIYSRAEYQELNNTTLIIKNIVYRTDRNNPNVLGNKASLLEVPEWAEIQQETKIENVSGLIGGYFKIPIANITDNTSPIGVPIFANAINILEEIDKQFSRTLWEYEGSELAIDVDDTAFKKDSGGKHILPKGKERLYRMLDLGDELQWNVFSPAIRDTPLFNGLNELLRQCESECQLAFGVLSKMDNIAKTATEINSSKQDYYVTVSDIQGALQTALEELIYSIDVLMQLYGIPHRASPNISFDWDDSILVDSEKKQTQALVERNAGLIDDIEYFVQTRDYSEEEATEYVKKMQNRTPQEKLEEEEVEE